MDDTVDISSHSNLNSGDWVMIPLPCITSMASAFVIARQLFPNVYGLVFGVLPHIFWQSAFLFSGRVEFAYPPPQVWVDLFSALIAAFMKSCHNHFFNLCAIQRYLTTSSCQGSGSRCVAWLYHSETRLLAALPDIYRSPLLAHFKNFLFSVSL